MQLRDAISDLKEIRAQLDRTSSFRGFRSMAVGFSGILALVGATLQLAINASWQTSIREFLLIWLCVAVGSLVATAIEMAIRSAQSSTRLFWSTHRKLAIQIAPSFFVGAVLTLAIILSGRGAWMLPAMWALIYSLGLFACWQHMPRMTVWAALYYLIGGTICLWHSFATKGVEATQTSAFYMVVLFGGGQLLLGWILYWTLERNYGKES